MAGGVKQRRSVANYLNVSTTGTEKYVLMGAGFTELNESPGAQTQSKRYINNASSSTSIVGYEWSTSFNTDQIRDEEAVEFICNIGENLLTGSDAEAEYVIVDLDKKEGSVYSARKIKVAIEVADFEDNDGEMGASGTLLGVSQMVKGTFNVTTNSFTSTDVLDLEV
ncbi:MAG: hypothetical protein ACRCX2_33755 [Paraclostridium sp.]